MAANDPNDIVGVLEAAGREALRSHGPCARKICWCPQMREALARLARSRDIRDSTPAWSDFVARRFKQFRQGGNNDWTPGCVAQARADYLDGAKP